MTFDIYAIEKSAAEDELDEGEFQKYLDELIERFAESPEGQARFEEDPGMGFWAHAFLEHGYTYAGVFPTQITAGHAQEIVSEILPRKITLNAPEDADDALPELIALWTYLQREYRLPGAAGVLQYLRSVKPDTFRRWMTDPRKAGMAKSFMLMGQSAGFDMTNEQDINRFMAAYNASLALSAESPPERPALGDEPLPGLNPGGFNLGLPGGSHKGRPAKEKRARKIAKASRKKNRKRK